MMKLHVCPTCKYRVLTSRRLGCTCRKCRRDMLKVDTIGFEEWWQLDEAGRINVVDAFLESQNPA
ncbi:MAG: hypothetical protein IJW18_00550 [Lachnospiraceae bacterium]|nr:hypothetical protein [Lachnospiraceae bacterium]